MRCMMNVFDGVFFPMNRAMEALTRMMPNKMQQE